MYAEDYGPQITTRPSGDSLPASAAFSMEERYRKAGERLSAAQHEKMEATLEFLAARTALSHWMERVWPGQERP